MINRVAVVGAGLMGSGIAHHLASHGADVVLIDRDQVQLDKASPLFDTLPVTLTTDLTHLVDREFVIEAVFEDIDIKRRVLREVSAQISHEAVIATNTSSLLVSDLRDSVVQPNRFIGVHFNNPPNFNPIVEIIPSAETTQRVTESVYSWIKSTGKRAILCADTPCFILNRQSLPYINEAARCLDIATPAQIDAVACEHLGVGLGPFAVMNLVGLPVMAAASRNLSVLGRGYQPSTELQERAKHTEPAWEIGEHAELGEPSASTVKERLLGAMIFPGKDILAQTLCSRDDLHVICMEALGYGKSSAELLDDLDPTQVDRLISIFLDGHG
jgi:3-hydroxyacyl-CoA dehydrogenase